MFDFDKKFVLNEGGNAIKDASPIRGDLALPLSLQVINILREKYPQLVSSPLGSTGKKSSSQTSGDLDIAIQLDFSEAQNVISFLRSKFPNIEYKIMNGFKLVSVGYPYSVKGEEGVKKVQVDLMFCPNVELAKFYYHSPDYTKNESKFKGQVRNILIMSILKNIGVEGTTVNKFENGDVKDFWKWTLKPDLGLVKVHQSFEGKKGQQIKSKKTIQEDTQSVSTDPNQIVKFMLGKDASVNTASSFESLVRWMMSDKFPYRDKNQKIFADFYEQMTNQQVEATDSAVNYIKGLQKPQNEAVTRPFGRLGQLIHGSVKTRQNANLNENLTNTAATIQNNTEQQADDLMNYSPDEFFSKIITAFENHEEFFHGSRYAGVEIYDDGEGKEAVMYFFLSDKKDEIEDFNIMFKYDGGYSKDNSKYYYEWVYFHFDFTNGRKLSLSNLERVKKIFQNVFDNISNSNYDGKHYSTFAEDITEFGLVDFLDEKSYQIWKEIKDGVYKPKLEIEECRPMSENLTQTAATSQSSTEEEASQYLKITPKELLKSLTDYAVEHWWSADLFEDEDVVDYEGGCLNLPIDGTEDRETSRVFFNLYFQNNEVRFFYIVFKMYDRNIDEEDCIDFGFKLSDDTHELTPINVRRIREVFCSIIDHIGEDDYDSEDYSSMSRSLEAWGVVPYLDNPSRQYYEKWAKVYKDEESGEYIPINENLTNAAATHQKDLNRIADSVIQPYVDLGLSVKWGIKNLGANQPWEEGDLYPWGYKKPLRKGQRKVRKYDRTADFDAAAKLGKGWRMPTINELAELREKCDFVWDGMNGVRGCHVLSRKDSDSSIFLPLGDEHSFCCWTSDLANSYKYWNSDIPSKAYCSGFSEHALYFFDMERDTPCVIRPVYDERLVENLTNVAATQQMDLDGEADKVFDLSESLYKRLLDVCYDYFNENWVVENKSYITNFKSFFCMTFSQDEYDPWDIYDVELDIETQDNKLVNCRLYYHLRGKGGNKTVEEYTFEGVQIGSELSITLCDRIVKIVRTMIKGYYDNDDEKVEFWTLSDIPWITNDICCREFLDKKSLEKEEYYKSLSKQTYGEYMKENLTQTAATQQTDLETQADIKSMITDDLEKHLYHFTQKYGFDEVPLLALPTPLYHSDMSKDDTFEIDGEVPYYLVAAETLRGQDMLCVRMAEDDYDADVLANDIPFVSLTDEQKIKILKLVSREYGKPMEEILNENLTAAAATQHTETEEQAIDLICNKVELFMDSIVKNVLEPNGLREFIDDYEEEGDYYKEEKALIIDSKGVDIVIEFSDETYDSKTPMRVMMRMNLPSTYPEFVLSKEKCWQRGGGNAAYFYPMNLQTLETIITILKTIDLSKEWDEETVPNGNNHYSPYWMVKDDDYAIRGVVKNDMFNLSKLVNYFDNDFREVYFEILSEDEEDE